jgi:hypothetical protein
MWHGWHQLGIIVMSVWTVVAARRLVMHFRKEEGE